MKRLILSITILMLISGCSPSDSVIQTAIAKTPSATPYPTFTNYPTNTPYSTYTPFPTYTIVATYTAVFKVVTATFTSTPKFTPTETLTPTITNTPVPTKDPMTKDKKDGFYLVGVDIAPGVWRSTGSGDSCYWAITTKTDNIINNHFGMAGGTMYVMPSGYQVELDDCGTWTYLGE